MELHWKSVTFHFQSIDTSTYNIFIYESFNELYLFGGFQPWKIYSSNWIISPNKSGLKFQTYLSCHHPDMGVSKKNRGTNKKNMNFNRLFHYFHTPSILEVFQFSPYFWFNTHLKRQHLLVETPEGYIGDSLPVVLYLAYTSATRGILPGCLHDRWFDSDHKGSTRTSRSSWSAWCCLEPKFVWSKLETTLKKEVWNPESPRVLLSMAIFR